ncbi:MAG TPA: ParB N-terminal domain-containing protein [Bacteroidia bacterium]|jgi:ParB-like chromosome segregation protein Spo0J|nr:ParB N-terminal domain-containing protein [Bacteroidia bacterium]
MSTNVEGQLIELDPSVIDANPKHNARFGLKPSKVTEMAEKIVSEGQLQPIEVSPLPEADNGFQYRLSFGNYRLAAIKQLNKEGAGLTVKAIVRTTEPGKATTIRQLTENLARQENTRMDDAVAIKKLLDAGVDKMTIRSMFSVAGRKGPVSNSWLNITLGFLDLPTKVQNKLHTGEIDWSGGAVLYRVNRDNKEKLPEVLKELEDARQKAIDKETREEEKFIAALNKAEEAQRKQAEAEAKQQEAIEAKANRLKTAEEAIALTDKLNSDLITAAQKALDEATEKVKEDPSEGAKAVAEAVKKLESTKKAADKSKEQAAKDLAKLKDRYAAEAKEAKEKAKLAAQEAKEAKKEVSEARAERQPDAEHPRTASTKKSAADKPTTGKDVAKAAAAVGAGSGGVKLTYKEIREVVDGLCKPGGEGAAETKAQKVGIYMRSCFFGISIPGYPNGMTEAQFYSALLKLLGGK